MSDDLTLTEQRHVRTALRFLRRRVGAWQPLADGLNVACDTIEKVVNGRRPVTPRMAFRVARFADVSIGDLLEGRYLPGACPHCGLPPDFADETTAVESAPRSTPGGGDVLKIVR